MEIVCIFAERLFAFRYPEEEDNEYDRLLNLWNDVEYVYNFLKENREDFPKDKDIWQVADHITEDVEKLDEILINIEKEDKTLSCFFRPLHNLETGARILSLQKGRQSYLRIYAVKIDEDIFVITGGAIKLHHLMEEREHTKVELQKLHDAQAYLRENGVYDGVSFHELLNEN